MDAEKWQQHALLICSIFYHLHTCDTFERARTSTVTYTYARLDATRRSACVCLLSSVIRAMPYNCI